MEYPASKTRSLNIAFVVNAELLSGLAAILGETANQMEYTAKFSDGTSVRYSKIEEIIGQPNSGKRSIVSLIAGTAERTAKSAFVNLSNKPYTTSLEYTINGTQRDVIYFADKLDDWVAAIRQWYSPLFFGDGVISLVLGISLPVCAAILAAWLHPYISPGKGIALIIVALTATGIAELYIFRLFPRGTFAIGHGEKRHRFLSYVRNTVLVGLAVSVIGGVIANWIATRPAGR